MESTFNKDGFGIQESYDYAARKGIIEYNTVFNTMNEYHHIEECKVYYPKNLYPNKTDFELLVFFNEFLIIGKLNENENVEITRLKYKDIKEVKMWFPHEAKYGIGNAISISFDTGREIVLNSLEDTKDFNAMHFETKINNIYRLV